MSVVIGRLYDNLYMLDAARDAFREFENELKSLSSNNPLAFATVDRRMRLLDTNAVLEHHTISVEHSNKLKE